MNKRLLIICLSLIGGVIAIFTGIVFQHYYSSSQNLKEKIPQTTDGLNLQPFQSPHKEKKSPSIVRKTFYYGNSEENFVDIYYIGADRTAIFVHGGAFITGSARSKKFRDYIRPYFLGRGYNVASVEYRKCTETDFKNVISDIYTGIKLALKKISALKNQTQIVYVGISAGSTAGAILLAGKNDFKIDKQIKYFILLSGVYNPIQKTVLKRAPLCEGLLGYMNYSKNVSRDIHVFLIEGTEDSWDLYPQTNKSHLEYFKNILKAKGVKDVKTLWIEGGHSDTIMIFKEAQYLPLVDSFLGIK